MAHYSRMYFDDSDLWLYYLDPFVTKMTFALNYGWNLDEVCTCPHGLFLDSMQCACSFCTYIDGRDSLIP